MNPRSQNAAAVRAKAMSPREIPGPAQAITRLVAAAEKNAARCLVAWARPVTTPRALSGASACTSDPVTANMAVIAPSARVTVTNTTASHAAVGVPPATTNACTASAATNTVAARRTTRAGHMRFQRTVTQLVPTSAPTPPASAISHRYCTAEVATVMAGVSIPTGSASASATLVRAAWASRGVLSTVETASRSDPVLPPAEIGSRS